MRNKTNKLKLIIFTVLLILIAAYFIYVYIDTYSNQPQEQSYSSSSTELTVVVIDVGQADSILVTLTTGETMLIDAGKKSDSDKILSELEEYNVDKIDVLVATHPHADHIGAMASVIERYDIETIYMPDKSSTSKTYSNLTAIIERESIPVVEAYAGITFSLGDAICKIISPPEDADEDANNESAVIFLDFYDSEFLFTGDMESEAEEDVLNMHYNIDADVLKAAHHGSSTGTSEEFLLAVSPEYYAISCGEDNKYGHPHQETLDLLEEFDIETLRTDISGDITFVSDGTDIDIILGD